MKSYAFTGLVLVVSGLTACASAEDEGEASLGETMQAITSDELLDPARNSEGKAQTSTPSGTIDTSNAFFQSLGTNGRTCNSCHFADQGWSITPRGLRRLFRDTGGNDPLFNPIDGADSPTAPYGTVAERRAASRNLLERGLVRVALPASRPTPTWDLDIEILADPTNANALKPTNNTVSFFRRPLPTTNLRFQAAINWDGRNTPDPNDMRPGLLAQANGATLNHAQPTGPIDDATRAEIVDLETSLATAQIRHEEVGRLDRLGARGGPELLVSLPFSIGMNSGASFDAKVFDVYDAWTGRWGDRGRVANGQRVFNEKTFGASGGTCGGCHNTPNVGSSSRFAFFDVGVSAASRWNGKVPLYRVRQRSNPASFVDTTDPGRAMITGNIADVNRFKAPSLRGLAARPPYFHDGSATSIAEVVDHYEVAFAIPFTNEEKRDLVLFLESL